MNKTTYFFIDDVIWVLRDITREKPASLFDNGFMKMLKKAHDENGMTAQLNLFYKTDFFYGGDEFCLTEVTDAYKKEFEEASDWLRLAFHARQEYPDYPYVNANYEDVKKDYENVIREIKRFAGEKSISHSVVPHWLPISKEGCKALYDCGVKFTACSTGDRKEFSGNWSELPYGHAQRLLQNKKPETMLFTRKTKDTAISSSICAYNHVTEDKYAPIRLKNKSILDEETGLRFKGFSGGPCLNLYSVEEVKSRMKELIDEGHDYIGVATHEQYYYKDYLAYQPDYAEKIYIFSRMLKEAGYRFITADEME